MTKSELFARLSSRGLPDSLVHFEESSADGYFVLKDHFRWTVHLRERGQTIESRGFPSEQDALWYVYKELLYLIRTPIHKGEHFFSVDLEQTKEYYKKHSLCACAFCRNYCTQIKAQQPELAAFLAEFGVDAARPDEISSLEAADSVDYIQVDYSVCGKAANPGEYVLDLPDGSSLPIRFQNGSVSPNEQSGEHFTLSVMDLRLPWRLKEPMPET